MAILKAGTRQFLIIKPTDVPGMFSVTMYQGRFMVWNVIIEESRLAMQTEIFNTTHPLAFEVKNFVPQELKK